MAGQDLHVVDRIYRAARESEDGMRCCMPPSPELQARIRAQLEILKNSAAAGVGAGLASLLTFKEPRRVGLNDGLIVPGNELPLGASPSMARAVAMRAGQPLHGTLNVIVVLVEFQDKPIAATQKQFDDLFFSQGVIPTGSVREYFQEVTNGKVRITGEVVGPYTMPQKLSTYAGNQSGLQDASPNARTLAKDAALAANPDIDFSKYDNDSDGTVDAFVIVHAGRGGEETGQGGDIWSHKWVLEGGALPVDGSRVFAYLTVPEDAKLGVCAHELGHLLFGFPDLYDSDSTSSGVGDWCLMGGGSWLNGGLTPSHPSAWCKCQQTWATEVNVTKNGSRTIADVKSGKEVLRLWKDGAASQEYFLVEHRRKTQYDQFLPGEGLLVWHIDDSIDSNTNEVHPRVRLIQADGLLHLEKNINRGDAADPYPGSGNNRQIAASTTPNSRSYGKIDTLVALADITTVGANVTASVFVSKVAAAGKKPKPPKKPAAKKKPVAKKKAVVKKKAVAKKKAPSKKASKKSAAPKLAAGRKGRTSRRRR